MSVQQNIEQKLTQGLSPSHIDVQNESANHNVPPGSESHFKVVLVANAFDGKPLVAQHRLVYEILADELASSVHALALHTYTTSQWAARDDTLHESPNCRGGKARES